MRSHTLRQAGLALLSANAVRPLVLPVLKPEATAIPAFAAGGLTGELAPQLLLAGMADTAVAVVRRKASPAGVALSVATSVALGYVAWRATGTGATFKEVLRTPSRPPRPPRARSGRRCAGWRGRSRCPIAASR